MYTMDYYKTDQVTWVSIRTHKNTDLLEMKQFYDQFRNKDYLTHQYNGEHNLSVYNAPDAEQKYANLGNQLGKDLNAWNNDERNRSKISKTQKTMEKGLD